MGSVVVETIVLFSILILVAFAWIKGLSSLRYGNEKDSYHQQ